MQGFESDSERHEVAHPRDVGSRTPTPSGVPGHGRDEVSLLGLANVLLRRWRLVTGLPLAAAVLAAVISLLVPSKYTATASFVPESENTEVRLPGGVSALAAQFGVSIPKGDRSSPDFYADVLRSRTLRDHVLGTRFRDPRRGAQADSAVLLEILNIRGETESRRMEEGRKRMERIVSVGIHRETQIVTISAETHFPTLSAAIANQFIVLLNQFNLRERQSTAKDRRIFVEQRSRQAEEDLRGAEAKLQLFLENNRDNRAYETSPELRFQYERLQRDVSMREEVFTTLERSYEEARIQEVNDAPVITVIDSAIAPQRRSSPNRKLTVVLAFLLAGVLAVLGAFGRDFLAQAKQRNAADYEDFISQWAEIKLQIRSFPRRRRS